MCAFDRHLFLFSLFPICSKFILYLQYVKALCIYKCSIRHDCSGVFLICMTCTYGEMFPAHDSSVLFQGHAYLWFCTANKPNHYLTAYINVLIAMIVVDDLLYV